MRRGTDETLGLGDHVRKLRLERGVGLRELARAVSCTPAAIQRVEAGSTKVSEDLLTRIAGALQVDSDELLRLAGKVPADVVQAVFERPDWWPLIRKAHFDDKADRALQSQLDRLLPQFQRKEKRR